MLRASITFFILALIALVFPTGCSSTDNVADKALSTPTAEAQAAAREAGAAKVIEVNFQRGSHALTDASRSALRELVNQAKATGKIDELKILSWSDVDYPTGDRGALPAKDRTLANRRGDTIREFAQSELGVSDVDTYNMAQRPNALQELFNTSDARIKEAFESAGVTSSDGKALKGNASHAVVMAMLEN